MASDDAIPARNMVPDVHFALPDVKLRPLITTYYGVTAPIALEDHLHPEWGNIRFILRGEWTLERPGVPDAGGMQAALFGPTDRTAVVRSDGPGRSIGVGLSAMGWATLIGTPAHKLANHFVDLTAVFGPPAEQLWRDLVAADWAGCCARLNRFFGELAAAAPPPDPLIERVQQSLVNGNIDTVQDFANGLALTERTLARLCNRAFGFSPKRLLRRQRFFRTLAQLDDRLDQPLGSLLDGGYYDQSHFIREFKSYMGMTPLAYFNAPRQMMRRASAERLRTVGARVQGLHQA